MERPRMPETLYPKEFRAWQGLFKGFAAAAEREHTPYHLFHPTITMFYSTDSLLTIIHTKVTLLSTDKSNHPEVMNVRVEHGQKLIATASTRAEWQKASPFIIRTHYAIAQALDLNKVKFIGIINDAGGILEQPDEFEWLP